MVRILARALTTAAAASLLVGATPMPPPHYAVTGSIPGPDGGWDYASVGADGTVYVARSAGVTVVDPAQPAAIRSIGSVMRGHAVVPIPDEKLLMVTSGGDASVRLIEPVAGREVARIAVGANPDAAFYDAAHHRAAVMNARDGTVSVIDVAARKVVRTITLKPGLEFAQAGPGDTLYVNNEETSEIETANLSTGAVGPTIALPGCEGPSGLAYDARSHRLISACANGKAAVVDTSTNREIALLDIGQGPDAVILDARARMALIPCGKSGSLSVISLLPAIPAVVGMLQTAPGARTGAVDPRNGTIYLPAASFSPPAIAGQRPTMQPGSFHILVVKTTS